MGHPNAQHVRPCLNVYLACILPRITYYVVAQVRGYVPSSASFATGMPTLVVQNKVVALCQTVVCCRMMYVSFSHEISALSGKSIPGMLLEKANFLSLVQPCQGEVLDELMINCTPNYGDVIHGVEIF